MKILGNKPNHDLCLKCITCILLFSLVGCGKASTETGESHDSDAAQIIVETGDSDEARAILAEAISHYTGTAGKIDEPAAKELFLRSAEIGGPLGTMWLARLYFHGRSGLEEDRARAQQLAGSVIDRVKALAETGDTEAMFLFADALFEGLGVDEDFPNGHIWLLKAAEAGHTLAQSNLGLSFIQGKGVARDLIQARKWIKAAADNGSASGHLYYGGIYEFGVSVPKDYSVALQHYQIAAEMGSDEGQRFMARMYLEGYGTTQNTTKALEILILLADKGNTAARMDLGDAYIEGNGVKKDPKEAVKWYRLAAEQGLPKAQFRLGWAYSEGEGVNQDHEEAVGWYRKAASQGDVWAQNNLGWAFQNGQGVPQNHSEAAKWYLKAANQGNSLAQINLGRLYEDGNGVVQDYLIAYVYYSLASASGDKHAPASRDRMARYLSAEQLTRAQAMAAEKHEAIQNRTEPEASLPSEARSISKADSVDRTGSGFFVHGGTHVVSNAHVVEGCSAVEVVVQGQRIQGTVQATDPSNDLALVKLATVGDAEAIFGTGTGARLGEEVAVVGFPLHGLLTSSPQMTTGVVSALAGMNDDSRLIQITAPIQPGNSGGPVIDRRGHVIGVAVGKLDSILVAKAVGTIPENVAFAVRSSIVSAFLSSQGIEATTSSSKSKLDTDEIGERARSYTVRVECWE